MDRLWKIEINFIIKIVIRQMEVGCDFQKMKRLFYKNTV